MFLFIVALAGLAFGAYHLAMRRQVAGLTSVPPHQATPTKRGSVVGIAQPWEQPQPSPATGKPVLWSRAYRATQRMHARGNGRVGTRTHRRNLGKVRTQFQLLDEHDGRSAVAVDSSKLGDTAVDVPKRTYRSRQRTGRLEEVAVYPGDRVWVHGRIEQQDGYLGFARRGTLIHGEPPEAKAAKHSRYGLLGLGGGLVAGVAGGLMVLFGG